MSQDQSGQLRHNRATPSMAEMSRRTERIQMESLLKYARNPLQK